MRLVTFGFEFTPGIAPVVDMCSGEQRRFHGGQATKKLRSPGNGDT
jgi:hypothetical protein